MSDSKRRKDNRAALNKCWTEDIEWELIPNTLREGCAQIGKALSVPAASVLSGLLILMSYFTSHAVVNPFGTDWFEPMLVWIVIVMPTGAGKSTLFKFLKGILRTVRKRVEEMEQKNGNGKVADWVIEEASMEKMGAMMCDNSNKIIGIYDELTHFLTQINIYRNRGLSDTHDLAMFLQLYNGLPWSRRTVGGECNFVMDYTSLTVGGFTQPTTATNIMVVPGNAEKGLSQRFLWICPKPVFLEYDSLGKVDQVFYDKVVNLLFMFVVKQQKAPKKINEYYLTDIAKDTFKDAFNDIQKNLKGISGADDLLSGMLSKSKGQLLRVTGCLHCLFQVDDVNLTGESPDEFQIQSVVTDAAMRAAINFVNTCMNHTLYLCGRDKIGEEVDAVLTEVTSPAPQPKDDSPVNAASNPGGYMLLIPGKRLHITALNERKKFRDMGNKQGAVETINALEKDGLGLVLSNRTQGTAKQYTFVKCDVEGAEAEMAAKLARYGVSLRQYKKSLMEEELLPTRISSKRKHSTPANNKDLVEGGASAVADEQTGQTKSPRRSPRLAPHSQTPGTQQPGQQGNIRPRSLEDEFVSNSGPEVSA